MTDAETPPPAALVEALPDDLRAQGWSVAVHNDYRQLGARFTFWLLTKNGRAVKGEGSTDAEALNEIRAALAATPQEGLAEPRADAETTPDAMTTARGCFTRLCEWDAMSGAAGEFVVKEIAQTLDAFTKGWQRAYEEERARTNRAWVETDRWRRVAAQHDGPETAVREPSTASGAPEEAAYTRDLGQPPASPSQHRADAARSAPPETTAEAWSRYEALGRRLRAVITPEPRRP